MVAIAHVDRGDHPGAGRLHDLAFAALQDFSGRGGDDIDFAQDQPGQRDGEADYQHPCRDAAGGRNRALDHFKRGGQEIAFVGGKAPAPLFRIRLQCRADHAPVMAERTHWMVSGSVVAPDCRLCRSA